MERVLQMFRNGKGPERRQLLREYEGFVDKSDRETFLVVLEQELKSKV